MVGVAVYCDRLGIHLPVSAQMYPTGVHLLLVDGCGRVGSSAVVNVDGTLSISRVSQ